jgi:hypothetical protein
MEHLDGVCLVKIHDNVTVFILTNSDALKPGHVFPAEQKRAHHRTSNRPPNPRLKRIVISCSGAIAASIPFARGFHFLGYTYSPAGLGLAEKTIRNHRIKLHRLYEQYLRARKGAPRAQIDAAITTYIALWTCWATGGLHGTSQLDLAGALDA